MNKKNVIVSIVITFLISGALALIIVVINQQRESDYIYQQTITDDEFSENQNVYVEKYPISFDLPIIDQDYDWRIDYGICETSSEEFCIMISADNPVYYEYAMTILNELESYENGKYNIEFLKLTEENI